MGSMVFKTRTPVGGRYGFNVVCTFTGESGSACIYFGIGLIGNFLTKCTEFNANFGNLSEIVYHLLG